MKFKDAIDWAVDHYFLLAAGMFFIVSIYIVQVEIAPDPESAEDRPVIAAATFLLMSFSFGLFDRYISVEKRLRHLEEAIKNDPEDSDI